MRRCARYASLPSTIKLPVLVAHPLTPRQVPEDLQSILNDNLLFSSSAEITTKEILKRYGDMSTSWKPATPKATDSTAAFSASQTSPGFSTSQGSATMPPGFVAMPYSANVPGPALQNDPSHTSQAQNSTTLVQPASNPSITHVNPASSVRPVLNGNPNMIGSFYGQPGGKPDNRDEVGSPQLPFANGGGGRNQSPAGRGG